MKFINKKIILVVIILMIGIILWGISKPKDNIKLESVNLKSDKDNSIFAIMLEQDDGTYKEDNSNTWPTSGYTYNANMSGCIDVYGNQIKNAISYNSDTNNIVLKTKEASYCYLYFSLKLSAAQSLIKEAGSDLWNSTLEDDGYRYVGTNPNNYVCFGTTDKSTCTGNTDLYMYRIIGIFEDSSSKQHLKLIKKEALNTWYKWHSDYENIADWDGSDLYKGINGDYFLTNKKYSYMQNTIWTDKIVEWNYTATNTLTLKSSGPNYSSLIARNIYLHELNRSTKTNSVGEWKIIADKIGLMYVSDYVLSLGNSSLDYTGSSSALLTGWMHITQNDSATLSTTETAPPITIEWTMSRAGEIVSYYGAWQVDSSGNLFSTNVANSRSVRPVFYLESDVEIKGGIGTIDDPYIIG